MKEYIVNLTDISEYGRRMIIGNGIPKEELIRCKDCKYWMPHTQFGYDEDSDEYHNYCKRHLPDDTFYAFMKEADDFCSWAERKKNEYM